MIWGIESFLSGKTRSLILSGLLMGLAAWTRPEGYVLSILALIGLFTAIAITDRTLLMRRLFLAPYLLLTGSWFLFSSLYGGESFYKSVITSAIADWKAGSLHFHVMWEILIGLVDQLFSFSVWGIFSPVLLIILFTKRSSFSGLAKNTKLLALFLASMLTSAAMVVYVYMASLYEYIGWTLQGWIELGLNRFLIPSVVLAILLMMLLLRDSQDETPQMTIVNKNELA
jgi:hypothetical protein